MNKRVSVKDVARQAGVSLGTVSNYLNDTKTISPRTRTSIEAAISSLGYRRNQIASSLRTSRTKTLGIVVPSVANPFYTSLFEGAEIEAREHGYTLALGVTHYEEDTMLQYLDTFCSRRMDGIIINAYNAFENAKVLEGFEGPVVVVEPPVGVNSYSTIQIDNFAAGKAATAYLLSRGHRRIAIVPSYEADDRFLGYQEALSEAGLSCDPNLVLFYGGGRALQAQAKDQQGMLKRGEAVMHQLLDRTDFTACFFTLDVLALGALKSLRDRGLSVPEDVAIVGFDDIPTAAYASPSLTTIAQPHNEMGALAVRSIASHLASGRGSSENFLLAHHLVVRASA